jgi:hypothetical protein
MKIKHSKTGKTIKVPKHLESSVRQAINAGTDPMSVMAEGGAVQFPKFGAEMNVPRALYPSNNMNLSMHRNGGLVKYANGNTVSPITNDQEVMFANNDPYRSLMYNNDPLVSPYPYVGQTAPVASLADLVRPRPALMEGDPNYAPIEELNSMSGSVALKPRSIMGKSNYFPVNTMQAPETQESTLTNYSRNMAPVVMNTIQPKSMIGQPIRRMVPPDDLPMPEFDYVQPRKNSNAIAELNDEMSYSPYALATNLTQALIQQDRINKTQAPTPFDAVGFTAGVSPNRYDLSAQRQAIDADTAAANMGIRLGGGSYSTQAGNYQKMRNLQMQKKGESFQNETNLNTQAMNEYNKQMAAAANETSKANAAIDQANREALYNYNLWKTGAKNAVTADTSKSVANIFNNLTAYNNQLESWKAYANRLEGKRVKEDTEAGVKGTEKNKYGGMIKSSPKRTLKKKAGK